MPAYDYECKECDSKTTIVRKHDDPEPYCEKCGRELSKLFSPPLIIFNGPGFYSTDYKNK